MELDIELVIALVLVLDIGRLRPSWKSRSGLARVQRAPYWCKPQGWHQILHVSLQLVMRPDLKLRLTLALMSTLQLPIELERSLVSIQGPLGYEPNTLTTAPLCC